MEDKYNKEWRTMISSLQISFKLDRGLNYVNENTIKPYVNIPFIFNEVLKYEDDIGLFFHLYLSLVESLLIKSNQQLHNTASELFRSLTEGNTLESIRKELLNSTKLAYASLNPLLLLQFQRKISSIRSVFLNDTNANQQYGDIENDLLGLSAMLALIHPMQLQNSLLSRESIICFVALVSRMTNSINSLLTIRRGFNNINNSKKLKKYFLFFCTAVVFYYMNMFIFQNEVLGLNRRKRQRK